MCVIERSEDRPGEDLLSGMAENSDDMKEIRVAIKDLIERQKKTKEEQMKIGKEQRRAEEARRRAEEARRKTEEEIRETSKKIREIGIMVGNLTDGWGKFVEGLVEPSIPRLFRELGIEITGLSQRARKRKADMELEIDLLATGKRRTNGEDVIIAVEAKSNLRVREVEDFIENLKTFFDFFNEHRGKELIGVVSGVRLTTGAKRYAEKEGLYILGPSDETMIVLNKEGFKPKIWR